jgi:hypothetical protein
LDDVASLVAPGKPENARAILMAFYRRDGVPFKDLVKATGLKDKTLRYYITKLRYFHLIFYDRAERVYRIDLGGFRARCRSLFVDPIENLITPRWRGHPDEDRLIPRSV